MGVRRDILLFNSHAYPRVNVPVYMPDAALAIGAAEHLAPTGLRVYPLPPNLRKVTVYSIKEDVTKSMTDGQGETVDMSTFPRTGYMGSGLGGW